MVQFCGQEKCLLDSNGRLKIAPKFLADFRRYGQDVMLHCLSEGALGVFPFPVWEQMRQADPRPARRAATSVVFRREQRRFGAFSQAELVSNQGRITIPPLFRPILDLEPGSEVMVVGREIGIEVWNCDRWEREIEILRNHEQLKAEAEMTADVRIEVPHGPR